MKTLKTPLEDRKAESIVKGVDYIIGYNGESEVFAFRGVTDFSGYVLDGEYDTPKQTPDQLLLEIQELKKRLAATEKTTLALIDFM